MKTFSSETHFGIRQFRKLLLAGSFATVIEFLMGLSDSIVAGNILGENALAGINLLSPIMNSTTFFAGLIGVGTGINYAFEQGRCDQRRAREFFSQGVWSVLIIGSLMMSTLFLIKGPFLSFMAPGDEILKHASSYWTWFIPSGLLEPVVILLVNATMCDGDSRLCFTCYITQLVVNLTVSIAGVTLFDMGAAGCSFGTFVTNIVAMLLLSSHFLKKSNSFAIVRHFRISDTLKIMKSSFGDSSSFLCTATLFFFLNKYIISHFGSGLLPALATVTATIGFLEIFNGVGTALSPIMTVYAGERNTQAMRTMMAAANRLAFFEGLALNLLLMAFPQLVVKMVGIDDLAMYSSATTAIRIVSCSFVFYSFIYLYNSYYIFIEHETLSVAMTIAGVLALPVFAVFCTGGSSPMAVWAALAIAPAIACAAFAVFMIWKHGVKAFPLLLPEGLDENIHSFSLPLETKAVVDVSRRISDVLKARGAPSTTIMRASLMAEEVMLAVLEHNNGKRIHAEATLDLNDGIRLTIRDDGAIFDITDTDQQIASLRTFLVASVMERQKSRINLVTSGFNRNVFKFQGTKQ